MFIYTEFFYISSIKSFGFDRILVEQRLFSSGTLETLVERRLFSSRTHKTLGTELSETFPSGGTICSAGGTETTGVEGFSNGTECTIASGVSAKSISGSSQCLGSESTTFEPASSRG